MFSMMDLMDPHRRQGYNNSIPCFVRLGSQPDCCSNRNGPPIFRSSRANNCCERPDFDFHQFGSNPVANVMRRVFEARCVDTSKEQGERNGKANEAHEKDTSFQRKRKGDAHDNTDNSQSKCQKEMNPAQPTLQDVMNSVLSSLGGLAPAQDSSKWQEKIDCSGFESRNIKVNVDNNELLLKAFRKHESEDGMRTMGLRKRVPLPANIDKKKLKCKLSSNGVLIIEAPYMGNDNKENALEVMNDIVTAMLPGLEQMLRSMGSCNGSTEKENCDKTKDASMVGSETSEKESTCQANESDRRDETEVTGETLLTPDNGDGAAETSTQAHNKTEEKTPVGNPEDNVEIGMDEEPHFAGDHGDDSKHGSHYERVDSNTSDTSFVLLSEHEEEEGAISADVNHGNSSDENIVNTELDAERGDATEDEKTQMSVENGDQNDSPIETTQTQCEDNQRGDVNDKVLFRLEMPSYNSESMKVSFDNTTRLLSIVASKDQTRSAVDSPPASITKTVPVDDNVDVDGLQCYFRDGTLTVKAPLKPTIRTIHINA